MLTLNLPWPDSRLSPNSRLSWQAKNAPRQAARQTGHTAARDYRETALPDRIQMTVIFHPPDLIRRDADNILSSLKPTIDGIFEEIGRDDQDIQRVVLERGKPLKGGSVTVILGEVQGSL